MFPCKLEMIKHIEVRRNKDEYPGNHFRYNLRVSSPKSPLGPSPFNPKRVQQDGIRRELPSLNKSPKHVLKL
jgi:hypothetical protein